MTNEHLEALESAKRHREWARGQLAERECEELEAEGDLLIARGQTMKARATAAIAERLHEQRLKEHMREAISAGQVFADTGAEIEARLAAETYEDVEPEAAGEIPEGFTAWPGATKDRPNPDIPPMTTVAVLNRKGETDEGLAGDYEWETAETLMRMMRSDEFDPADDIIAYRILQAPDSPASEPEASGQGQPQTDAGSAPEAAQGAGIVFVSSFEPGSFGPHEFDCATHIAPPGECNCGYADSLQSGGHPKTPAVAEELTDFHASTGTLAAAPIAPGDVQPDPSLHPEHDGTGYWSGTVDGETP